MRALALLIVVLLVAASFSWLSWWSATDQTAAHFIPVGIVRGLNLPVAVYARLTNQHPGIDLWFGRDMCCFCSYEMIRDRYLRHAIAVWSAIFAIPAFAVLALDSEKRD